jgi:F-type H+-transporting ATPase subunit epsilon
MATMRLEIITAERLVYADDVEIVVAPGVEGQLGILPYHSPLMTALQPGEIMVRKSGQPSYLAVTGGFMEVLGNRVTILANACEHSDEIDEARAQTAVQRAKKQMENRKSDLALEHSVTAMRQAQVRLNVVRRRSRVRPASPIGGTETGTVK